MQGWKQAEWAHEGNPKQVGIDGIRPLSGKHMMVCDTRWQIRELLSCVDKSFFVDRKDHCIFQIVSKKEI